MARRDFYNLLGVPRDAGAEDIKRAFRSLARQVHPDLNPADAAAATRFQELHEAWRTLSDPDRRARYDRLGPLYTEDGRPPDPTDLQQVWRDTLAGLFGRRPGKAGADLRVSLQVTLESVSRGGEHVVAVPRKHRCDVCDGAGAPVAGRTRCNACAGTGRSAGPLLLRTTCWHCGGRGFRVTSACRDCGGDGVVSRNDEVAVVVPAGAGTGTRLKVKGHGDASATGPHGDLFVVLVVVDHPLFVRHGEDVVCDLPLGFDELLFGVDIDVPTLDGTVRLTVPAGTAPGTLLRLVGRGLPRTTRGAPAARGDALYRATLEHPVQVLPEGREALRRFRTSLRPENTPRRAAFQRAVEARR